MSRNRRWWWWLLAALPPLLYLPLHAQDGAPVPAASDAPDPAEERVSADNNLSFPVDI